MFVFLTGLSYRSAPLAVRETLSIAADRLPSALATLERHAGRGVILSTCNRTEVYSVVRDAAHGSAAFDGFVSDELGVDPEYLRPHVYTLEQDAAVGHLFRVASSLDSQIIGESEILGQVRDAFGTASRAGMAGGALAHLFHSAIRTGKRARTETAIGRNALSVSRACVELARRSLGELGSKRGLVVGVGEASRLAAQALRDAGLTQLTVANRTRAHAEELAESLGGQAASLDDLPRLLAAADVVVTSTGAPDFVITREQIEGAMEGRTQRPLLIVDIALPRDVEPSAASVPGVQLSTLDDLEAIAEANRREREAES
ncbi:MAG: glutamyl-tRNA reductase, partial [Chloroflexi bacterium]|nr:glutamyl-tRNA reductase [Chloroflexota bacterium]